MTSYEFLNSINDTFIKAINKELSLNIKLEPIASFKLCPWVDTNKEIIFVPLQSFTYSLLYNEVISQKKYKGDVIKDLYFLQLSFDLRNAEMFEFFGNKYLKDLASFFNTYKDNLNINNTKEGYFECTYQLYFSLYHEIGHVFLKKNPSEMDDFKDLRVSLWSDICTIIPFWEAKKLTNDLSYWEEIMCDSIAFDLLLKAYKYRFPDGDAETLLNICKRAIWITELEANNYKYLGNANTNGYESVLTSTSLRLVFFELLKTGHYRKPTRLRRIPPAFSLTPDVFECYSDCLNSGVVIDFDEDDFKRVVEKFVEQEYDLFEQL